MSRFDQARLIRHNRILAANGIDPSGEPPPLTTQGTSTKLRIRILRHAYGCESDHSSLRRTFRSMRQRLFAVFIRSAWIAHLVSYVSVTTMLTVVLSVFFDFSIRSLGFHVPLLLSSHFPHSLHPLSPAFLVISMAHVISCMELYYVYCSDSRRNLVVLLTDFG